MNLNIGQLKVVKMAPPTSFTYNNEFLAIPLVSVKTKSTNEVSFYG